MTDSRKVLISVVASIGVIGLVVGLVLTFAIIPVPAYPRLADQPDSSIPGTVAFSRWESDGQCISTVPAGGGEEHLVFCDQNIGFGEFTSGWTPDGLLIVEEFRPNSDLFRLVDPETGDTVERIAFDMESVAREPIRINNFGVSTAGMTVEVDGPRGDPRLFVYGEDTPERTVLAAEAGPADYWFNWAAWSPDAEWILVLDTEGRVLIVFATGDPNPRILVEDIDSWRGASWFIPGHEEGTWDPRTDS